MKINNYKPVNHYSYFIEKNKTQSIAVVIKEQKRSDNNNKKYVAEVKSVSHQGSLVKSAGSILLLFKKDIFVSPVQLGDEYNLSVKVRDIPPSGNPHQFDYKKYLQKNKIYYIASVDKIISQSSHSSMQYKIKNFNQRLSSKVDRSVLNSNSKEFLKAFLLGDRAEMQKENIQAYSQAGIIHLIAISGMHMAFVFSIVFSFFSIILSKKRRKTIIIVSLFCIWLFGCFIGFSPSVFRACLMLTIYYFFELFKRISNIFHSMALSAFIILLFNPNEIYSIGFQLSFAAVFFIAWLSPGVEKLLSTHNIFVNQKVIKPLAVILAAQIGTLPLVLFYFHQFSLVSIPANIFLIPYTYLIVYASVFELINMYLPEIVQQYFHGIYDKVIEILRIVVLKLTSIDFLLMKNISFNVFELSALLAFCILLKKVMIKFSFKTVSFLLVCILFIQINRMFVYTPHKENLIVFSNKTPVIGVRKGNQLLILKDKEADSSRINSYIIDPYLAGERIRKIVYQNINYHSDYVWKERKIHIRREKNRFSYSIQILGEKKIEVVYNSFKGEPDQNLWSLKQQGAFLLIP